MMTLNRSCLLPLPLLLLVPGVAQAHTQAGVADGFLSGFLHPLAGPDHMVAMVAVGLWGAQLGAPALWQLPVTFPALMAIGGFLGVVGVFLPGVEVGIALSAIVLGAAVLASWRAPLPIALLLVAAFAIFHGYAHGAELPDAVNPLAYGVGFVLCTGLLHLVGILLGLATRWPAGARAVQAGGAVIAGTGAFFLWGALG
jgi:urease accessory protein